MVDFTPNYLCDPDAMRRIHSSTTEPRRLRFIVVMRDPVMRAFSEWSMFALGWNWDHVKNFTESMRVRNQMTRCWGTPTRHCLRPCAPSSQAWFEPPHIVPLPR